MESSLSIHSESFNVNASTRVCSFFFIFGRLTLEFGKQGHSALELFTPLCEIRQCNGQWPKKSVALQREFQRRVSCQRAKLTARHRSPTTRILSLLGYVFRWCITCCDRVLRVVVPSTEMPALNTPDVHFAACGAECPWHGQIPPGGPKENIAQS